MKPANYAPIYACVYAQLAEVARSHGYALAAHGSLAADFDLVCIPWVPGVSDPQSVVDEITSRFAIKQVGAPERKKHGRIAYTISFEFGECRLDLSFMPTEAAQDQGEVQRLREALPYLRNAVAEASASGVAQLAVVSTKPDGSGKLVCKFECVEFMADLAAVVGAGPQTEDDDARAEARKFLQRNGIASTGQEVEP